jgi:hypothetical protein
MGANQVGARWLRRATRITGLEAIRGWGFGGYLLDFTTADHVHFLIDIKSKDWYPEGVCRGYSSCSTQWDSRLPEEKAWLEALMKWEES